MTTIDDLLHAPVELLLAALQERQPRLNTLMNSPLVLQDPRNFANQALSTGATKIEIPLLTPVPGGYSTQDPGTPPPIAGLGSKHGGAMRLPLLSPGWIRWRLSLTGF